MAVTEACSVLPSNHGGSHFSWQSHRKLSLLMWLKGKHRDVGGVTDRGKRSLRTQRSATSGGRGSCTRASGRSQELVFPPGTQDNALGTQQLGDPGELTALA